MQTKSSQSTDVTLYHYQGEAVQEMSDKDSFLLADDMGLGKTVTVLVEIRQNPHERVLIVCPKTVIPVWEAHIKWLVPEAVVHNGVYLGMQFGSPCFVVTNYEQVRINEDLYRQVHWDYLVADEAHYLKNRKARRTRALKHIRATRKRALTGTPVINRPDELWSLLNWLHPLRYRSYWKFFEFYCDYWQHPTMGYKKVLGPKNTGHLRAELSQFTLRRLKQEVLTELPEKYYTRILVDLHPPQRRAYEGMKKDFLAWIGQHENEPVPAPVVVAQLTRLRQFAAAYAQYDEDGRVRLTEPSAKLDALMEIVEGTDQQIVVFSQFKDAIRLAQARLKDAGISYTTLTGDTPQGQRGERVESFQAGQRRVFLGTTGAGGVGITLHAASIVVFIDRSWSPADNAQAEDRLHRIGQKSAVQVILLEARDTVDQAVEAKLRMKWSWIKQILGKDG